MTFELLVSAVCDANIDWENPFDEVICYSPQSLLPGPRYYPRFYI